jgi:hypothetical protein
LSRVSVSIRRAKAVPWKLQYRRRIRKILAAGGSAAAAYRDAETAENQPIQDL